MGFHAIAGSQLEEIAMAFVFRQHGAVAVDDDRRDLVMQS